ncbi:complement C5-like isoform X1 [Microtus oregoni]|uniref:complement C5-like isoform X1 n=1 Tax=Microtus oregoni TaxID=111838 RepID=UPI001BB1B0E2|nr:complement C5-like isoform X1 [Microtus oregoni]
MPISAMGLWLALCFLIFLSKTWGQEQTFVISAPKVFQVGASENVVIQAHGYTEAFDVTISIRSYPDRKVTYSSGCVNLSPENKFQNLTLLTIQDKQLSQGQSSFSYVYLEVVSKHFSKSEKRPILYDNGSLFVHTDKPVYTPQQHVKVGVLSLGDALEPVTRETVLTFIDPEGSEVDKVQGNNLTGAVSFPDFQIPSNPKYGRWTIQAKYREDASTKGMTHFDVNEHNKAFKISLTPVSDRQHELKIQDEAQDESLQPTDYLRRKITEQAFTYKHPVIRTCCYNGARHSAYETCEQRADRVKIGPRCVQAFTQCCTMATQIRASDTFNEFIGLGRAFLSSSVQPVNHSNQEVEIRGYRPRPRLPGLQSQLEDNLQINREILS